MNATTKCPVCPLEDVPPTALQCPNCKTDLTLLRRIETLADSFANDAETLRHTDPSAALRALHTALSLEPQNEAFQRRVREAEGAFEKEKASPLRKTPPAASAPNARSGDPSPPTAPTENATASAPSQPRPPARGAAAIAAVAALAFGLGALTQRPATPPSTPLASAASPVAQTVPAPPAQTVAPTASSQTASSQTAPSPTAPSSSPPAPHHTDAAYAALEKALAAARANHPTTAALSSQQLNALRKTLNGLPDARVINKDGNTTIVFSHPMFAPGADTLAPRDAAALSAVFSALAKMRLTAEIEGHCDASASPRNWELALHRAASAATIAHAAAPALPVTVRALPDTSVVGTALSDARNRGVAIHVTARTP